MHIDIDSLTIIGFGCVALYLLWDRANLMDRIANIEVQHNKLCENLADFAEQVDQEFENCHERIDKEES